MAGPGPRANPFWATLALPSFTRQRSNPIEPPTKVKGAVRNYKRLRDRAVFDSPDVPSPGAPSKIGLVAHGEVIQPLPTTTYR